MKLLEKMSNVALILGVGVFLVIVLRGELAKRHPPNTSPQALLGKTVSLAGVHFPQERNSLILALSTSCHFCKESFPFYKELTNKSLGRVDVFAVLPQPQVEAQTYIQGAAIQATQVISTNLDNIGVYATPTILLVNSAGKVQGAWVGLLDEESQHKLLASARLTN